MKTLSKQEIENLEYLPECDNWKITFEDRIYGTRSTYMNIGFESYISAMFEFNCLMRNLWKSRDVIRCYWRIEKFRAKRLKNPISIT